MKRSRKTNRVSWAPAVNLCQVKLFLKEDCPSKVGGEHRHTLQAKPSWALHPSGMCANDDLSPGFEGGHYAGGFKCNLAKIPIIQWKTPPKFALNFNWQVVAGEESKEVEAQKLREKRVLEAVYPRLSVVPPNPLVFRDVEVEHYDDSRIPLVPLNPIEDDEGADVSSGIAAQTKTPFKFETPALLMPPGRSYSETPAHCHSSAAEGLIPGASSDVMAAALTALTTVMKSKEQGSMVDTDLLVKILSDPKMVEKLIHNPGHASAAADGNLISAPSSVSPETVVTSLPCSKPATISSTPAVRYSNNVEKEFRPALSMPVSRANIVSNSMPTRVEPSSFPFPSTGATINMNSGHRVANGTTSSYSRMNQVQSALGMMPVQPAIVSTTAMQAMEANTVKDANYYKNLIREHGREKEEAKAYNISQTGNHLIHSQQNIEPGASNTMFRHHCMFYNRSKGFNQGSNYPYLHDNKSLQRHTDRTVEDPCAKRMKLSGEITGRI
ncbi:NAD(P)-binding Rossmann-fold superfamily protein [Hibiscus syriacus]|uniref:NAD(P)-binding Rossmann-fold superfamily protein n=1 Tax=Hibiscus syriacus TaxID=106335 RepID=A0A6A2XHY7_HIBSY|nr:zinc finger CCCH domain-containing protein 6-like isoform X2 [Hibiscus syriacus]KAE8675741.1 NAD(P)-binding Rossmann-fold superfamily protein [Hibiscus syriacus]